MLTTSELNQCLLAVSMSDFVLDLTRLGDIERPDRAGRDLIASFCFVVGTVDHWV